MESIALWYVFILVLIFKPDFLEVTPRSACDWLEVVLKHLA